MHQLKSIHQQFREEGYLVLPQVFRGGQLEKLRLACDYVLEQFTAHHDQQNPGEDFNRMPHLNDIRWHQHSREHLHAILETVADPRCLGAVEQIFDGPSLFYATQYFVNPRFSSKEGNWHRDVQFLTKTDAEEKEQLAQHARDGARGIQFQLALVDNDDIEYVPYSANRYDAPEEYHIRKGDGGIHNCEAGMPNALRVELKAGDAVIFNPDGLHRGRYNQHNPRRTLMITYSPQAFPQYTHWSFQPWFLENDYMDGISPRAHSYLQEFVNTYRDSWQTKPAGHA